MVVYQNIKENKQFREGTASIKRNLFEELLRHTQSGVNFDNKACISDKNESNE